jgi:hypothetical protein
MSLSQMARSVLWGFNYCTLIEDNSKKFSSVTTTFFCVCVSSSGECYLSPVIGKEMTIEEKGTKKKEFPPQMLQARG